MKVHLFKLFFLFYLSLYVISCESQTYPKGEAPQAVKDNFQKKYPGENDPDWETDRNGNFEASFKKDGIHYNADFSPSGAWIETETRIKKGDLPKAIKKILKDEYDKYKIVEIEKVDHHSKGTFYDVELKDKGEKMDVEFKEDGTRIN